MPTVCLCRDGRPRPSDQLGCCVRHNDFDSLELAKPQPIRSASNPAFQGRPSALACRLTARPGPDQARIVSMICRAIPTFRNGSVYIQITARSVHGPGIAASHDTVYPSAANDAA